MAKGREQLAHDLRLPSIDAALVLALEGLAERFGGAGLTKPRGREASQAYAGRHVEDHT